MTPDEVVGMVVTALAVGLALGVFGMLAKGR